MEESPQNVCEESRFQQLFKELGASLRNFLFYKSGNWQQAEDLSQEAFIKLWKACAKVSPDKAKAFLYRVANNQFLDQVKHQKVVLKFQQQQQTEQDNLTPAAQLEAEELKKRIAKAIAELPEINRITFLMNRVDGLTYQEIADRLEISKKAVEKRMSKALVQLRQVINTQ